MLSIGIIDAFKPSQGEHCNIKILGSSNQQFHHFQEFLPVWQAGKIIHRVLFILQIQINDQQRAGGRGAGEDHGGIKLLDNNDHQRDHGEYSQYPSDRPFHVLSPNNNSHHGCHAIQVKYNISQRDERPPGVRSLFADAE